MTPITTTSPASGCAVGDASRSDRFLRERLESYRTVLSDLR